MSDHAIGHFDAGEQDYPGRRFEPANSANPRGRPKGSRNKVRTRFLDDLYEDWLDHGASTIERLRRRRPYHYVRAVIAVLPRHVKMDRADQMTGDELTRRIYQFAAELGFTIGLSAASAPTLAAQASLDTAQQVHEPASQTG